MKETLSLHARRPAAVGPFRSRLAGLTLGQSAGGAWAADGCGGAVVAMLPAPYAYDASGRAHGGGDLSLSTVGGVQELVMSLDSGWLDAPRRVFPVTVDPSVSNPGTENSAYISVANPTANYGTSQTLGVGYTEQR